MVERSPEKAGVGGSIPSLATTFSNTCRYSTPCFGSNWFQFQPADIVSSGLVRPIDQACGHDSTKNAFTSSARNSATSATRWRNRSSTVLVEQFPSAIQMTLGGEPRSELLCRKSESLTIANSLRRAYSSHVGVGSRFQPNFADMLTFAVAVRECLRKDRRQVLVEKQLHMGMLASLRSRSAANARQARRSSFVRSGKSRRISSSVIPDAR